MKGGKQRGWDVELNKGKWGYFGDKEREGMRESTREVRREQKGEGAGARKI